MNKNELITAISKKTGVDTKTVSIVVVGFTDTVTETLASGDFMKLVGFGVFEVAERAAREGRNPKTGESVHIPASKSPKFKAGSALKSAVK